MTQSHLKRSKSNFLSDIQPLPASKVLVQLEKEEICPLAILTQGYN